MVLGDAVHFVFGTQNHADALVQLAGFNVQNPLLAIGRGATGLLDQPRHGVGLVHQAQLAGLVGLALVPGVQGYSTEIGVGVLEDNNPGTQVGRYIITHNFGVRNDRYITGVAYKDNNNNGFYDNDSIVVKRLTKKRDFFNIDDEYSMLKWSTKNDLVDHTSHLNKIGHITFSNILDEKINNKFSDLKNKKNTLI